MEWIPFLKRIRYSHRRRRLGQQEINTSDELPPKLPESHCLIASFPRSGNTWISKMMADVLLQKQGFSTCTKLPINEREIIPDLDRGDLESCQHTDFAPVLLAKTHLNFKRWMRGGIYLFRQPADSIISHFHFHKRYTFLQPFIEDGVEAFCRRQTELWRAHAESFVRVCQERPGDFIPISFESLLEYPETILGKTLEHFGVEFDSHQIENAVSNHQFENYLKHEPDRPVDERFFRRGQIDSGKRELDSETLAMINEVCWPLYEQALAVQESKFGASRVA